MFCRRCGSPVYAERPDTPVRVLRAALLHNARAAFAGSVCTRQRPCSPFQTPNFCKETPMTMRRASSFSRPSAGPGHIAVATLNVPATLNSLDLTMVDALAAALVQWRDDPAVAMVYLRGAGDRAFCAGGDIQALYRSCKANREAGRRVDSYAEDFFEREYRLDYVLTFPKPVLCFGHGVVMGGGLGLLAASRFRVVTPKSRVAMPEITIGLFPDAGGTTLLSAMPGSLGLFLGLTGTHFRGGDARALGLGTHLIADDAGPALEEALRGMTLPQGNNGEATLALGKALALSRLD